MIKNAFYFIFIAVVILQVLLFLYGLFTHVRKLDKKPKVDFKIYDVTNLEPNV